MFDIGLFLSIIAQEAVTPRAIITMIFGALLIAVAKTVVAPTLADNEASRNDRSTHRSQGRTLTATSTSNRPSSTRVSAPNLFLMRLRSTEPRSISVTLVGYELHPREARLFPVYSLCFHAGDEAVEYDFKDMEGNSPFLNGDAKRVKYLISTTRWMGGQAPRPGERNKRGTITLPREKLLDFSEQS